MKTGVVIGCLLAAMLLALGCTTAAMTEAASQQYIAAAQELRTLADMHAWERAAQTLEAYDALWQEKAHTLSRVGEHAQVDEVAEALRSARAGISLQDRVMCAEACTALETAATQLADLERFTLENLL